jgi:hypothetical protein
LNLLLGLAVLVVLGIIYPLALLALFLLMGGVVFFYLKQIRKGKFLVEAKENHFVAIERDGGNFVEFLLTSKTAKFVGRGDDNDKWTIDSKHGGSQMSWLASRFGYHPVGKNDTPDFLLFTKARKFKVSRNGHDVIRPTQKGEVLKYKLLEDPIEGFNIPRFITHTFETSPINTMGEIEDPRNQKGEKREMNREERERRKLEMVATVVALLQVQIEIFNPYRALYKTRNFMSNVNTTLQSATRENISELGLLELIRAKTETKPGDDLKNFSDKLKKIVNGSLEEYGVKIIDVDFLDHHLADQRVEKALNDSQVEKLEAVARDIRGASEKRYDQQRAIGRAAEMTELEKAAKGDKQIILAEIDRRKLVDGLSGYDGTVLSLGGNGIPAIVDGRPQEAKQEPAPKNDKPRQQQRRGSRQGGKKPNT